MILPLCIFCFYCHIAYVVNRACRLGTPQNNLSPRYKTHMFLINSFFSDCTARHQKNNCPHCLSREHYNITCLIHHISHQYMPSLHNKMACHINLWRNTKQHTRHKFSLLVLFYNLLCL